MTLIFYSNQTDFEKVEKSIFKNVSEHSNESKMLLWRSMTFYQKNNSMNFYGGSKY